MLLPLGLGNPIKPFPPKLISDSTVTVARDNSQTTTITPEEDKSRTESAEAKMHSFRNLKCKPNEMLNIPVVSNFETLLTKRRRQK